MAQQQISHASGRVVRVKALEKDDYINFDQQTHHRSTETLDAQLRTRFARWMKPKFIYYFQFFIAFIKAVKNPKRTDEIFKIIDQPASLRPEDFTPVLNQISSKPSTTQMVMERYLGDWNLKDLDLLPKNTLGSQYAKFMINNNLDKDYYPELEINDDINYIRLRLRQTHDIWHVLTGFDTSYIGEAGLQAFYFAQLRGKGSALIVAVMFLHALFFDANRLYDFFEAINHGWQMGQRAQPLFAEKFEQRWTKDLETYKAELQLV